MNYSDNECSPQETRNYRGEVTSLYKKYCLPISVGLRRIGDGLVI